MFGCKVIQNALNVEINPGKKESGVAKLNTSVKPVNTGFKSIVVEKRLNQRNYLSNI